MMNYPEEFPTDPLRQSDSAAREADPFDQFESPAEVCAYVHRKLGEDSLRQLLAHPPKGTTREDLLDTAAELSGAGLKQAATIVSELAATALPMDDISFCVYTPDAPANVAAWLRSTRRRQLAREQRLRPMGKPGRPKAKPA
jgi:hypothetical protein